jgi:hypothetical protein
MLASVGAAALGSIVYSYIVWRGERERATDAAGR